MSACLLQKAFQQLNIYKKDIILAHYVTYTTRSRIVNRIANIVEVNEKSLANVVKEHALCGSRFIGLKYQVPKSELPLIKIMELPLKPSLVIDSPIKSIIEKIDIVTKKIVEVPMIINVIEKQAERMIVIRRKKIKKHKRRKWLKKFKFVIRKREQRKKNLKEKEYQVDLQDIIAKAEEFNAEQYVAERLTSLTKKRIPYKWRGELLPEDMIRQFMNEQEKRKAYKLRLRTYRLRLDN
ncbi:uncharacterized protein LOC106636743 [Copidosoma floridanum]|uniref:uncharacterized protein LOC106636743 n=1 Tax=Copidosoma floridanum TaxID=29053 RepID=UPI0006C9A31C|nr:uncharacterized protein LOC106636743 [Copidosoma floridanum]